jgi:hypothetical protein
VAEQLSAVAGSQVTQVPPPVPQLASPELTQAPDAQQPVGQDWALQTQAPATHTVPAPQVGPLPQAQAPVVVSHPSLIAGSQAVQARPARPQVAADGNLQVAPAQHPPAQELALHTQAPPTQTVPAPHAGPPPQ